MKILNSFLHIFVWVILLVAITCKIDVPYSLDTRLEASELIQAKSDSIPLIVRSGESLSLSSFFFAAQSHRIKVGKFSFFDEVIAAFDWLDDKGGISSCKRIFAAYAVLLSQAMSDPRLFILSSRAHPPTK